MVFRLVEFGWGAEASNPILANEAYQQGLDALPMVVALVVVNLVHPAAVLKGEGWSYHKKGGRWWRWGKDDRVFEIVSSREGTEMETGLGGK